MKIEITRIPNINSENLDKSKVDLANKIIRNIKPLFDDVLIEKKNNIEKVKKEIESKKILVKENKTKLEGKLVEYKRKQKVKKLLDKLDTLVKLGMLNDGSLRHEITILLKVIETLDDGRLDYHFKAMTTIVNKRFSQKN